MVRRNSSRKESCQQHRPSGSYNRFIRIIYGAPALAFYSCSEEVFFTASTNISMSAAKLTKSARVMLKVTKICDNKHTVQLCYILFSIHTLRSQP